MGSLDTQQTFPGMLFLVVGPSGGGKDSIIDGAKERLAGDEQFVFPQRAITRPKESGGEDHRALTEHEFEAEEAAGMFVLTWRAHDLAYGVPEVIENDLDAGRSVIVNVSRSIIENARQKFERLRIISVTASSAVIAERLRNRGRETEDDIQKRIARAEAYAVTGPDVIELSNDGSLDEAVEALVSVLHKR